MTCLDTRFCRKGYTPDDSAETESLKKENDDLKEKLGKAESLNVSLKAELAAALKELSDLKGKEEEDPFSPMSPLMITSFSTSRSGDEAGMASSTDILSSLN